jgi:predicted metal-binding membrane protein
MFSLRPIALPKDWAWIATGAVWMGLLTLHPSVHGLHSDVWVRLLGWQIMLVAMMLPASLPVFQAVAQLTPRATERIGFVFPYWLIWSIFGLLLVSQPVHWLQANALWQTVILIGAGLFQFSPLKQACLKGCQSAISMLLIHYQASAIQMIHLGSRYAFNCLGCCWALMLVMLAVGMSNLWVMALLTVIMSFERRQELNQHFSYWTGGGLIVSGLLLLLAI